MDRRQLIEQIEDRLAGRPLVWFGTRGTDAEALKCLRDFEGVYSLVARLGVSHWAAHQEVCLEELTGRRVDLNSYTIDADLSDAAAELHAAMMSAIAGGAYVAAYRACHFLSAASLARYGERSVLSMFYGMQSAFDHKPWVETQLQAEGVETIGWDYFSHHDWSEIGALLRRGPLVLRTSYSDGGTGLRMIREPSELGPEPPRTSDRLLAASRYLEPSVPLNVSGCVWHDGTVTLHAPSVQLVGHAVCTDNPFAYCGNDFASLRCCVSDDQLDRLEDVAVRTGEWLFRHGYRGAFGVDALLFSGRILLTEVNPRFQGCSALGAQIAGERGLPDIYLDHIATFLGVEAPRKRPALREYADAQVGAGAQAQVIAYADGAVRTRPESMPADMPGRQLVGLPSRHTVVQPHAMLFKLFVEEPVLMSDETGVELRANVSREVSDLRSATFEPVE